MGELEAMIPQGPHIHCDLPGYHSRHPNHMPVGSWCNGVPELEPFLELVVRVPLNALGISGDVSHEELVKAIADEGWRTYTVDEVDNPETTAALRVRWGGQDWFYRIRGGTLERPEKP